MADVVATYGYDPAGREVFRWLPNRARVTHAYDGAGQVAGIATASPAAGPVGRVTYAYDGAGRRTTQRAASGAVTTFAYDPAGQLVGEAPTGPAGLRCGRRL